jgi:hypothetical protein
MKSALEIKPDISYKSAGKFEETRFEKIHNENTPLIGLKYNPFTGLLLIV